jgi:hypothetical protein
MRHCMRHCMRLCMRLCMGRCMRRCTRHCMRYWSGYPSVRARPCIAYSSMPSPCHTIEHFRFWICSIVWHEEAILLYEMQGLAHTDGYPLQYLIQCLVQCLIQRPIQSLIQYLIQCLIRYGLSMSYNRTYPVLYEVRGLGHISSTVRGTRFRAHIQYCTRYEV